MKYHSLHSFTYKAWYCFFCFTCLWICVGMGFDAFMLHAQETHHQKVLHRKVHKKKSVHKVKRNPKVANVQKQKSTVVGTTSGAAVADNVPVTSAVPEKGTVTGLPLPRFLSLRADVVNMRAGPGMRYPILWIYHRRRMPVMVLREFDVWRLIQDMDGQKGWVQQAILTGERSFITTGKPLTMVDDTVQAKQLDDIKTKGNPEHMDSYIVGYVANIQSIDQIQQAATVRAEPKETASPIAVLKSGVVGNLKECPMNVNWCKVNIKSYTGWIPRENIWGVLPQEEIQPH